MTTPATAWLGYALLAGAVAVASPRGQRERRLAIEHALAPAQLLLYVVVLSTPPHHLEWHVATAIDRLVLQCLPAALVLMLAVVRGREGEATAKAAAPAAAGLTDDAPASR